MRWIKMRWISVLVLSVVIPACAGHNDNDTQMGCPNAHVCDQLTMTTPHGRAYCGHHRDSVEHRWVTEEEIAEAIDAGFDTFFRACPEFVGLVASVGLEDDYVFWLKTGRGTGEYVAGWNPIGMAYVDVSLWSRGHADTEPVAFIARPPQTNGYTYWRYTTRPLIPALPHELLHICIGDPDHTSSLWSRPGIN